MSGEIVERMKGVQFPLDYEPEQVVQTADGVEVSAVGYWLLLQSDGDSALLPRGVMLRREKGRETLEQFVVRAALTGHELLWQDE